MSQWKLHITMLPRLESTLYRDIAIIEHPEWPTELVHTLGCHFHGLCLQVMDGVETQTNFRSLEAGVVGPCFPFRDLGA
jgi:hypothetical protein